MKIPISFSNKTYALDAGSRYLIRPIQADDRERIIGLFDHLSPESRYLRFAHAISKLPDDFLDDILHLDYKKEMALVAVISNDAGAEEIVGISRYVTPPNENICEFSLSVSDQHTAHGIGTHLMLDLIAHAKENGLQEMLGYVLSKNLKMLHLVSELGFQITNLDDDPDFKTVSLSL
jgi:N-acetylglutamate synthase-like GNAT family acetyltransferase